MADEDYMPDPRDLEACPACGSGRIACVLGLKDRLDFCMQCQRVWEPIPLDEPYTLDGEQLPFQVPCDNCAFRGNSPERAQEEGEFWKHLQLELAYGGQFYCHKGVPFSVVDGSTGLVDPTDRGFEFPRIQKSADIAGKCHPYQAYDTERMRLCRGYLNAHVGPLLKKVLSLKQQGE
jgi:hypothetical protein